MEVEQKGDWGSEDCEISGKRANKKQKGRKARWRKSKIIKIEYMRESSTKTLDRTTQWYIVREKMKRNKIRVGAGVRAVRFEGRVRILIREFLRLRKGKKRMLVWKKEGRT